MSVSRTEVARVAGRELDAEVAEKVMGWEWRTWDRAAYAWMPSLLTPDMNDGRRVMVHPKHGNDYVLMPLAKGHEKPDVSRTPPRYSTDIAAAWQVVEKMEVDPREIMFSLVRRGTHTSSEAPGDADWHERRVYEAQFRQCTPPFPEHSFATAATAPLAICLAALNAMEGVS